MKFLSADLESLAELIDGDQLQGQRRAFNPRAHYSEEQKQAAADFEAARKVPVFGPFEPMMR